MIADHHDGVVARHWQDVHCIHVYPTFPLQIIMMVGLPGTGKTSWAEKQQKEQFNKRYTIIGTDSLIDKMKVCRMGLDNFSRLPSSFLI